MDKLLVSVGATIVLSAAGAGSVLLSSTNEKQKINSYFLSSLSSSTDIEKAYEKIECLKSYFPTVNWGKTNLTSNTEEEDSKFKTSGELNNDISSLFSGTLRSCLLIEYDKSTNESKKWKGNFKSVWVLSNENNGLILTTTAKTNAEDGMFEVDGTSYILNNSTSWKVKSYGQVKKSFVTKTNLSDSLVKQGEAINSEDLNSGEYWGFDPLPETLCQASECNDMKQAVSFSASWEFKESENGKPIYKWSGNFEKWTESLFPKFFDKEKLLIGKVGIWVKK